MAGVPQSDRESRHLLLGTLDRPVPRHDDSHVVAKRRQGFRQTAGHIAETAYLGEGIRLGGCEQDLHWNLEVDMRPGLKAASGTWFLETNSERIVRWIRSERSRRIFPWTSMQRAVPATPLGHLLFVLHTHLPWVLGHGRWPHGEAWLHEATAECYLPLLRLLDRLEKEGRKGSITIGLTPVLAEMLASPRFRAGFLAYLQERTNRAEADRAEFEAAGDQGRRSAAAAWADFYRRAESDFVDTYGQGGLAAFTKLQNQGRIEIIVSAATHGYLPLLGRDESINAQIATGIASYHRHFGRRPRGIWLPECAYRPGYEWSRPVGPAKTWPRPGLEEVVGRHGLRYFFVDTHLVAGGAPIGTYEDRLGQRRLDATRDGTGLSPNEPYTVSAAGRGKVAILARDPRSSVQVWSADYGYPGDGAYLEFHRKHGMDGLRYWRVTDRQLPLREKVPYDPDAAKERAAAHADHFASVVLETLHEHQDATGLTGLIDALRATRSRKDPTVRRIVAQLARELLLLEASDWPFLVTTVAAKDYAEARVKEHVKAFDRLRTMLERAKEGTLAPDDATWLAAIEERDSPFPDLDLESWTLEP